MNERIKDILDTIKSAGKFEIFLIVFISLPFVLNQWLEITTKFSETSNILKLTLCIIVTIIYVCIILSIVIGTYDDKRIRLNADIISTTLSNRSNEIGSIDYLNKKTGLSITPKQIEQLIQKFPSRFRKVNIKGGKEGIGLIYEEDDNE